VAECNTSGGDETVRSELESEREDIFMRNIYTQSNDAERNDVIAFRGNDDGSLTTLGHYATEGQGSGKPHLASQSSVALSPDGSRLFVTNAGSNDVSVFATGADGLDLLACVPSGGESPTSVAAHGSLVYVLNAGGTPNITGFRLGSDGLEALGGSTRPLSADSADPAQIAFNPDGTTLVVTERGTNSISTYAVGEDGLAEGPTTIASLGATPYGFDFADRTLVVTEAFGGEVGAAAASSYRFGSDAGLEPVSGSVRNTRSEVCWAAASNDGRFVYVTNFGDGTISRYATAADGSLQLEDAVAATTVEGEKGVRDEALSADGRFLYALDADAQRVFGWAVADDGSLDPVGSFDGLPATVAGLASS
jgi:6-phosphogluconolactonase